MVFSSVYGPKNTCQVIYVSQKQQWAEVNCRRLELILTYREDCPSIDILWVIKVRNDLMQKCRCPCMPRWTKLWSRHWCGTLSRALLKSCNSMSTSSFFPASNIIGRAVLLLDAMNYMSGCFRSRGWTLRVPMVIRVFTQGLAQNMLHQITADTNQWNQLVILGFTPCSLLEDWGDLGKCRWGTPPPPHAQWKTWCKSNLGIRASSDASSLSSSQRISFGPSTLDG